MSKISKNIKMLDILSSGKKYTCNQLSQMLEVSPRMVRLYKDELEKEGIYIDSFLGKDGGYQLRSKLDLPSILFNNEDIKNLEYVINNNKNNNEITILENIKQKIINYCRLVNNEDNKLNHDKKQIFQDIQESIKKKTSIKIQYYSKDKIKERIIYPKQIYIYDKLIMIVAQYSEDKSDIRHLNLNRINKIIK